MSDRKAELEKKKARLQAMREEKERRRKEKEQKDAEEASLRAAHADKDQRKELDEMLSSLGVAPVSDVLSSLSSVTSTGTAEQSNSATPDTSLQVNTTTVFAAGQRKKSPQLSVVSVQTTSIPPKEMVTYTKQTQTTNTPHERDGIKNRPQKKKVDIEAIRRKYENELKSIPDKSIILLIKQGKNFMRYFKETEKRLIDQYKLCTDDKERFRNSYIKVHGIPVKIIEPYAADDVSIKRFFALIHGESYSRSLKGNLYEHDKSISLKSAIITNVWMPDVCNSDETVALVGTGFEYHTDKFKQKKALLFYYTILLDYLAYVRNRQRNKVDYLDINRFLAEGDKCDKTINISTVKAVTRQMGYGVDKLSAVDQKQVITWLKETNFFGLLKFKFNEEFELVEHFFEELL